MTALGDVLEVIFARSDPEVALHAVVREWREPELTEQAVEMTASDIKHKLPALMRLVTVPLRIDARVRYRRQPHMPDGPTGESQLEVWRDELGRLRLERTWDSTEGAERLVTLAQPAPSQWRLPRQTTVDKVRAKSLRLAGRWPAPSTADAENLFDLRHLRELLSVLEIVPVGESTVAGRAVLEVTAKERSAHGLWPHWLPTGADHYQLSFDLEHGHLLKTEGTLATGSTFESQQVTSIVYGDHPSERLLTVP